MISKELLSLVLGREVEEINLGKHYSNGLTAWYKVGEDEEVDCEILNLDTLGRLCKEWCNKQHYSVLSGWYMTHWGGAYSVEVKQTNKVLFSQSTHKTELEAIISATEWIQGR